MILFEFEGKSLFSKYDINIPKSQLISSPSEKIDLSVPFFAKTQVLSGKRKNSGGIIEVKKESDKYSVLEKIIGSVIKNEKVESILLEEKVDFSKEYYLSITYDTKSRSPVITYSESGGTGIEERISYSFLINILTLEPTYPQNIQIPKKIIDFVPKLLKIFIDEDCTLVEINPLVLSNGKLIALDAKIRLDETALAKHKERILSPRAIPGHTPTKNEIEAKKIDENDYKGTAGSAYFDLPGDIAVLASGGGASLTAMDTLIASGGKPANYTEYSGNPSKEKVEKLTRIVLSKQNLHGLWVVGAIANFTDIYETLSGFLEALRKINPKPKYPIVIRRGGPNDKKAFEMLRKIEDFDLHLYGEETSITESAKIMAKLAQKYAANT